MTAKTTAAENGGPLIYRSMLAVMADMEAIGKSQKNAQQGFNYRGIDQVYNALNPLLTKHGIFMTSEVLDKTREERTNKNGTVLAFTCLKMRYHFHAADGSSVATEVEGEGMDSGDKSSNKAMAVAHKYALLQAYCIPTQDMPDPDGEAHEIEPRPAVPAPPPLPEVDAMSAEVLRQAFEGAPTLGALNDLVKRNAAAIRALQTQFPAEHKTMMAAASKRKLELTPKEGAAT